MKRANTASGDKCVWLDVSKTRKSLGHSRRDYGTKTMLIDQNWICAATGGYYWSLYEAYDGTYIIQWCYGWKCSMQKIMLSRVTAVQEDSSWYPNNFPAECWSRCNVCDLHYWVCLNYTVFDIPRDHSVAKMVLVEGSSI